MTEPVAQPTEPPSPVGCFRHPDRATALRCSRCDRPACPECLREAPVGYHCVECVAAGNRVSHRQTAQPVTANARRLVVVPTLVLVNVAFFAITAFQAQSLLNNENSSIFSHLALWPRGVVGGAWWQLFTSGFMHAGPLHIASNMVALWIIGRDVERLLGRVRFSVVYLLALFGGGVAVFLFTDPDSQTVGASGAVFGLMGGLLVLVLRLKLNPSPVISMIVINLVLSVAIPGISLVGHLGGLVVGAAVTAAFVYLPTRYRKAWQIGVPIALIALLIALVIMRYAQLGPWICFYGANPGCIPAGT